MNLNPRENAVKRSWRTNESAQLLAVVTAVVTIAALYFARVVLLPLALALLLSLVLAPPVGFLERIKLPRLLAIFLVIVGLVGLLGVLGWKTSQQIVDLTSQLPKYRKTLQDKIHILKGSSTQNLNKASDTVKELSKEITAETSGPPASSDAKKTSTALGSSAARPMTVEVVPQIDPFASFENLLGPLGTAGLVIIFTIFILVDREDLRNRLIHLAGGGRLNTMTQALDEATARINRYLFLQLLVNCGYGLVIFAVLHLIGIPNASLWGLTAGVLRFLPYVGPPLAALMPILLSLAFFPGWYHALATAGLFLVLELVVANAVEPLLYGAHLGLAPLAILVAAVFWTMIWGLPGLVLSTPLTVCVVVMGRYVPRLRFLNELLGDEPVLTPQAHYYQRLLATDQSEAKEVLEESLKGKTLEQLYSSVVIPALSLAEQDRHRNDLDDAQQAFIYQSTREIIEELAESATETTPEGNEENSATQHRSESRAEILCIPARDEADDVVGMLLVQLLERQGFRAQNLPIGATADMLSQVKELNPGVVCISALPPFAIDHVRALYGKLRVEFPKLYVMICLWHFEGDAQKAAVRLKLATGHGLFTTLPQVLQQITLREQKPTDGVGELQTS